MNVSQIKKYLKEYLEDEENVCVEIAPLKDLPSDLPVDWKEILISDDPVKQVLTRLWLPYIDLLPETVAGLQNKLRAIGLLQTKLYPFSLLYVFEEDGEVVYSRGYPCRTIERDEAKLIPSDFLKLYKIHDGWTDLNGYMGPLPSEDWFDLNDIYDGKYSEILPGVRLKDYLVICESGGSGYLGFDLSKKPPLGLICSTEDPVEVVPDVVRELDKWMGYELRDLT